MIPFHLRKPHLSDYINGFLLAVILTVIPFATIAYTDIERGPALLMITVFAILQIGVHDTDHPSTAMLQPRADGDLMTKIPGKLHDDNAMILRLETPQNLRALVLTAVIDKDNFIIQALFGQRLSEPGMERL